MHSLVASSSGADGSMTSCRCVERLVPEALLRAVLVRRCCSTAAGACA